MRILFVCAGNTCRSPMAAAIAKREVAEHGYPFDIDSAGTDQCENAAQPDAITVAHENGCDLTGHEPKPLTEDLLEKHDRVFVMTRCQIDTVRGTREHPCVETLGEDVVDPYDRGLECYRTTWEQLERLIHPKLAELSKYSDAEHSHR
jgi:protein-tyrosine-phosphatase